MLRDKLQHVTCILQLALPFCHISNLRDTNTIVTRCVSRWLISNHTRAMKKCAIFASGEEMVKGISNGGTD